MLIPGVPASWLATDLAGRSGLQLQRVIKRRRGCSALKSPLQAIAPKEPSPLAACIPRCKGCPGVGMAPGGKSRTGTCLYSWGRSFSGRMTRSQSMLFVANHCKRMDETSNEGARDRKKVNAGKGTSAVRDVGNFFVQSFA